MKRILALVLIMILGAAVPGFAKHGRPVHKQAHRKTQRKHHRHHKNRHKGHLKRDPYPGASMYPPQPSRPKS